MKIDKKELFRRDVGKVIAVGGTFLAFMLGLAQGFTGTYAYGLEGFYVLLGLGMIIGCSLYFYYKGKHFEVEQDALPYVIIGLTLGWYAFLGLLWSGMLLGAVQYLIGRFVGGKKK